MSNGRTKKAFLGAFVGLAAFAPVLLGTTGASAAGTSGSPCLKAPDARTYTACEALAVQPAYEYTYQGATVGVPDGRGLIKELAEDGTTANGTPDDFRGAARAATGEYFDHEHTTKDDHDSPCLMAVDKSTYVLCAALWDQPSYDRADGSGTASPTGSELIAEIAEEGATPSRHAAQFRREAREEIGSFFETVRH